MYTKFGDALFYMPDYWYSFDANLLNEQIVLDEKDRVFNPEYEMVVLDESGNESFTINGEHYSDSTAYISRWWDFCGFFIEKDFQHDSWLNTLNSYRRHLSQNVVTFGGNKMYYLNDQCEYMQGVGQWSEWNMSWSELEHHIADKAGHLLLDLADFIKSEKYREEFQLKNELPISIMDDFSDLDF